MTTFNKWNQKRIALIPNSVNTINLDPTTNIVKVINESMTGAPVYLSLDPNVSQNLFEEKAEKGSSTSLVRPFPMNTMYIFNPIGSVINIKVIEIETDDISFIFNATNQVQVTGQVTSDALKGTDLNLDGSRNQGVTIQNTPAVTVSGTPNVAVTNTPAVTISGTPNVAVTGAPTIQGNVAHDGVASGNPVRLGARAVTANYTPVATGDVADLITTLVGALINKPYSIPELDWVYAGATPITVNTDIVLQGATAGVKNYITGMQVINTHATQGTEYVVKDGATVIFRGYLPPNMNGDSDCTFPTPLRSTANTALNFQCITAGANVYVNAQGYKAP